MSQNLQRPLWPGDDMYIVYLSPSRRDWAGFSIRKSIRLSRKSSSLCGTHETVDTCYGGRYWRILVCLPWKEYYVGESRCTLCIGSKRLSCKDDSGVAPRLLIFPEKFRSIFFYALFARFETNQNRAAQDHRLIISPRCHLDYG